VLRCSRRESRRRGRRRSGSFTWHFGWIARTSDAAQRTLAEHGIPFELQDHVVAHSMYFTDPDGHRLELTTYEL
jgi:catechol-2,3-dioxygenase